MRRILASLVLLLAGIAGAHAQACSGTPNANTVCAGPTSGGSGFPGFRAVVPADVPTSGVLDTIGSTRGSVLERGAAGWQIIAPGTSGLPWVSNGTGADPGYQALTAAGIAAATITSTQIASGTVTGGNIASATITNSNLAAMTQNAVKGAATSTAVADLPVGSCSGAANALTWVTNTGFGCNTIASGTTPYTAVMVNGTIVQSQATNAQTFALKTLAGADPSVGDSVTFLFRNATAATGNYTVRTVTAALSITIPSGQGIGFLNATPGRVWIGALDNAGTVELFVINCATQVSGSGISGTGTPVTGIYPLRGWGIISTSAVSGASAAQTAYSTTARSSVPYVPIGYATWETGGTLATAGTWNTLATRLQLFQPGSTPLPGTPIQRQRQSVGAAATGTTAFTVANTIPQNTLGDQYMSQVITPVSSADTLDIRVGAVFSSSVADNPGMALFQDTTANAVVATYGRINTGTTMWTPTLNHLMLAGTLSSTTFKVRAGGNQGGTFSFNAGDAVTPIGGGVANSYLQIEEIMN